MSRHCESVMTTNTTPEVPVGTDWKRLFEIEYGTVDRVWKALGFTTYEQSGGKAIWELAAEAADAAKTLPSVLAEVDRLREMLRLQTEQQAYPCSPHCAGYLREQSISAQLATAQSRIDELERTLTGLYTACDGYRKVGGWYEKTRNLLPPVSNGGEGR